jgi:hypothetical protein
MDYYFDEDGFDSDGFDCEVVVSTDDTWIKVRIPFRFPYETRVVRLIGFNNNVETRAVNALHDAHNYVVRAIKLAQIKRTIEARALRTLRSQTRYITAAIKKVNSEYPIITRATKRVVKAFKIEVVADSFARKTLETLDKIDRL